MSARIALAVEAEPLERVGAELAVVGVFEDERPLRGAAGVADWRLCGWLSELLVRESVRGQAGERVLVPTFDRLGAPRLLLLGLGGRHRFDLPALQASTTNAVGQALALGVQSVVLGLPFPRRETRAGRLAEAFLAGVLEAAPEGAGLWVRLLPAGMDAETLRDALDATLSRAGTRGRQVALRPADPVHGGVSAPRTAGPRRVG